MILKNGNKNIKISHYNNVKQMENVENMVLEIPQKSEGHIKDLVNKGWFLEEIFYRGADYLKFYENVAIVVVFIIVLEDIIVRA